MNIDKFGRINVAKAKNTISSYEIDKLENMIILLKSEIMEITARLDGISNLIIKEKPVGNISIEQTVLQSTSQ